MKEKIYTECLSVENSINQLKNYSGILSDIATTIIKTFSNNGKIFFCGNGGSAADSQHIAAEFTGRFLRERESLPAIALTTNSSVITAIGNDYGYEQVFSRQISGLMNPQDCLIVISTSGESKNIIKACEAAQKINAKIIAFTGNKHSSLLDYSDICFQAPSEHTPRIQELHLISFHIVCNIVEAELYANN